MSYWWMFLLAASVFIIGSWLWEWLTGGEWDHNPRTADNADEQPGL